MNAMLGKRLMLISGALIVVSLFASSRWEASQNVGIFAAFFEYIRIEIFEDCLLISGSVRSGCTYLVDFKTKWVLIPLVTLFFFGFGLRLKLWGQIDQSSK